MDILQQKRRFRRAIWTEGPRRVFVLQHTAAWSPFAGPARMQAVCFLVSLHAVPCRHPNNCRSLQVPLSRLRITAHSRWAEPSSVYSVFNISLNEQEAETAGTVNVLKILHHTWPLKTIYRNNQTNNITPPYSRERETFITVFIH